MLNPSRTDATASAPAAQSCASAARASVALVSYIFDNDAAGQAFLDALVRARARGIETRGIADHGMIDSIYFRDPNGYVIELTAKRPDHDAQMNPAANKARAHLDQWQRTKPA